MIGPVAHGESEVGLCPFRAHGLWGKALFHFGFLEKTLPTTDPSSHRRKDSVWLKFSLVWCLLLNSPVQAEAGGVCTLSPPRPAETDTRSGVAALTILTFPKKAFQGQN